jgi:hypothetical protein
MPVSDDQVKAKRAEGRRAGGMFGAWIILTVMVGLVLGATINIQTICPVATWPKALQPLAHPLAVAVICLGLFGTIVQFSPFGRTREANAPHYKAIWIYDRAVIEFDKWTQTGDQEHLRKSYQLLEQVHGTFRLLPSYADLRAKVLSSLRSS